MTTQPRAAEDGRARPASEPAEPPRPRRSILPVAIFALSAVILASATATFILDAHGARAVSDAELDASAAGGGRSGMYSNHFVTVQYYSYRTSWCTGRARAVYHRFPLIYYLTIFTSALGAGLGILGLLRRYTLRDFILVLLVAEALGAVPLVVSGFLRDGAEIEVRLERPLSGTEPSSLADATGLTALNEVLRRLGPDGAAGLRTEDLERVDLGLEFGGHRRSVRLRVSLSQGTLSETGRRMIVAADYCLKTWLRRREREFGNSGAERGMWFGLRPHDGSTFPSPDDG